MNEINQNDYLVIVNNSKQDSLCCPDGIRIRLLLQTSMHYSDLRSYISNVFKTFEINYTKSYLRYYGGKYKQDKGGRYDCIIRGLQQFESFACQLGDMLKRNQCDSNKNNDAISSLLSHYVTKERTVEIIKETIAKHNQETKAESSKYDQVCYTKNELFGTYARVMAAITKEGEFKVKFYTPDLKYNSHAYLSDELSKTQWSNRELIWTSDIKRFGAFYNLLSHNKGQTLIIYGSSCDYPVSRLSSEELELYKCKFQEFCDKNNFKLIFDPFLEA